MFVHKAYLCVYVYYCNALFIVCKLTHGCIVMGSDHGIILKIFVPMYMHIATDVCTLQLIALYHCYDSVYSNQLVQIFSTRNVAL